MRLIDADALDVNGIPSVYGTLVDEDRVKEWIDEAPTIDAAPISHSKWVYFHKQGIAVCKNCSFERGVDANYGHAVACPNCGAKMDAKEG